MKIYPLKGKRPVSKSKYLDDYDDYIPSDTDISDGKNHGKNQNHVSK